MKLVLFFLIPFFLTNCEKKRRYMESNDIKIFTDVGRLVSLFKEEMDSNLVYCSLYNSQSFFIFQNPETGGILIFGSEVMGLKCRTLSKEVSEVEVESVDLDFGETDLVAPHVIEDFAGALEFGPTDLEIELKVEYREGAALLRLERSEGALGLGWFLSFAEAER